MADKPMPEGLQQSRDLMRDAALKFSGAVFDHLIETKRLLTEGKITPKDAMASTSSVKGLVTRAKQATLDEIESMFNEELKTESEPAQTLSEIIQAMPEGHVARRQYKELFEAAQGYLSDTSASKRARLRRAINIIKGVGWGK